MEVSRSPSPTSSQALLSTPQVERKNQQHQSQRQEVRRTDETRQVEQQQTQKQQRSESEQRAQAANKPVLNTQGQTTGRVLNATA